MQPHDSDIASIDPVEMARQAGARAIYQLLRDYGSYVTPMRPLRALTKSLRNVHPIMLEGEPGAGKTAMPEALAKACNLPLFFFPCMDGVTIEDMLASFDENVQSQFVKQQLAAGVAREIVQREQWTLPFLNFGEVGAAHHVAAQSALRVILCIDEVDKLDSRREDVLLQVLARGYFDVPRLIPDSRIGSVPRKGSPRPNKPLIFLTSNNMRDGVSSPLRKRCYYSNIKYPSLAEQIAILRVRVPQAKPMVVAQVVKMMSYLRTMDITEKPALREMIDLSESLVMDNVELITQEVIEDSLCVFAKLPEDEDAINNRMSTLTDVVVIPEPEIEQTIARVYDIPVEELRPPDNLLNVRQIRRPA